MVSNYITYVDSRIKDSRIKIKNKYNPKYNVGSHQYDQTVKIPKAIQINSKSKYKTTRG